MYPEISEMRKALKRAIAEYNLWPTSELDAPLALITRKGYSSDIKAVSKVILSLDKRLRKNAARGIEKHIENDSLHGRVLPPVDYAFEEARKMPVGIAFSEEMETNALRLKFLIQIYNRFSACSGSYYSVKVDNSPEVLMTIIGQCWSNNNEPQMVIAYTMLYQTPGKWL